MHVQAARSVAEFDSLAGPWNRLGGQVPFRTWEWNRTWWRHYGQSDELFILCVYDGSGSVVGIAPWYLEHAPGARRVVRFLGSGEVCSEYATILATPGHEMEVCDTLAEWLSNSEHRGLCCQPESMWDLLELTAIDVEDDLLSGFALRFATGDFTVHERLGSPCWRISLPATWDEYLAKLSKPNRRRVRSTDKRLRDSSDCQSTFVKTNSEFEIAWNHLVDFHQRRRRSLNEAGCFASDSFRQFLHDLCLQFLATGQLEMVTASVGGRPIAVALNFRTGGVTYAYQVGIDPDSLTENPGWLVNTASIRHAIETGQRDFDLLRGDEPYKGHLGARPRACRELRIVSNRLRSQLWHKAWRTGTTMKDWLKHSLAFAGIRAT